MGDTCLANDAVMLEPTMPPRVAPAAMKPKSRLPLLGVEYVDHHRPEHRDHEEIENRCPDKKRPADPNVLLGAGGIAAAAAKINKLVMKNR